MGQGLNTKTTLTKYPTYTYKHKGLPNPTIYQVRTVPLGAGFTVDRYFFWCPYQNKWLKSVVHPNVKDMQPV